MVRTKWSGVFVVTVTPFRENGVFDQGATRELLELLISEGVNGIIVAGSTGEWFTMTDEERIALFELSQSVVAGRVPVIAGVSAISTDAAVQLTARAKELGLAGALVLPPPYILPTDRELESYFAALAEVGLPLMLYNNPGRTGVNLDVKWLKRLMRHPEVVSIKESTKDIHQLSAVVREVGNELAVFTGMETYTAALLQRGGAGVVAMAPNVLGSQAVDCYRAILKGDIVESRRLQSQIDLLYARMYAGTHNPYVVIKEAMRLLGRPGGYTRRPLLPFTPEEREQLSEYLHDSQCAFFPRLAVRKA